MCTTMGTTGADEVGAGLFPRAAAVILGCGLLVAGLVFQSTQARAAEFASQQEHRLAYRAQQYLEQKDFQACLDLVQPYLTAHNRPAATLFLITAQAQSRSGKEHKALSTYARAVRIYPKNGLLLRNYAVTCMRAGRKRQAANLFEQAFAVDKSPDLLYQAGAALYQAEDYARAAKQLQKLVRDAQHPTQEWIELLVSSLIHSRQWERAETMLLRMAATSTRRPAVWRLLAHVRMQRDDLIGAASALEVAYALKDPPESEWRNLAAVYAEAGVPLMAVSALTKALGRDPGARDCWRMGRLYAQALRIDTALEWMDKALAQEAKPAWLLEKARLLYTNGRYAQCREAARRAAAARPEVRGEAWLLSGFAAWQSTDWAEAEKAFSLAAKESATAARAESCLKAIQRIGDESSFHANE